MSGISILSITYFMPLSYHSNYLFLESLSSAGIHTLQLTGVVVFFIYAIVYFYIKCGRVQFITLCASTLTVTVRKRKSQNNKEKIHVKESHYHFKLLKICSDSKTNFLKISVLLWKHIWPWDHITVVEGFRPLQQVTNGELTHCYKIKNCKRLAVRVGKQFTVSYD
ncbi:Hypothetical predicted protein [Octopus vulgaris]|uniref:Uncharacterized protein n=1 Tax=Octopus vulgaris TaxID=6645 RepID=A0AA36B5C0_OCTVU|nr:Hypothetical predicted protein [Octopus vulgaris]